MALSPVEETVALDELLDVLSNLRQRRILVRLHDHDARNEGEFDQRAAGIMTESLAIELFHYQLLKLAEADFISWDRERSVVRRGQRFHEIAPLDRPAGRQPRPSACRVALMGVGSWVRTLRERSPTGTAAGATSGVRRGSSPSTDVFLTPAEQIVTILARHDGQMRQSEIVAAMDYSESSVSRRLCEMESTGAVTRYRIGREKLVFLPEAVPASFDSPIDR